MNDVRDFLFQLYTLACPFVPFAVTAFLLRHHTQRKQKSGADACLQTPSRRAERFGFIGIMLFGIYIAMVLDVTDSGTLYDLLRSGGLAIDTATVNLIPFSDPEYSKVGYVLNVIMLMPFGFLVPTLFCSKRKLWKTALAGALFSVLIECSQLLNYRSTDVDDVILNTLGAVIGYGIYRLFSWLFRKDIGKTPCLPCESGVLMLAAFLGKFFLYNGLQFAYLLYEG